MDLYDLLMAPTQAQRRIRPDGTDLQVLTIQADEDGEEHRYGRSRVIRELAAKAARDGHVPVIVQTVAQQWPKTRQMLLHAIVEACQKTADTFRIDETICPTLSQLLAAGGGPVPATVDATLHNRFQGQPPSDRLDVLSFALRLDLVALLNLLRTTREDSDRSGMRILLLLDDVHLMNEAAIDLVAGLLGMGGLRRASDEVRVAITYATQGGNPRAGESAALDAIKSLNDQNWAASVLLGVFRQPDEDRHAYERFLLHWSDGPMQGLALRSDLPAYATKFWDTAQKRIRGVPSRLVTEGPRLVRDTFDLLPPEVQILRSANDDDLLRQAVNSRR
jgi:hypothetical protein